MPAISASGPRGQLSVAACVLVAVCFLSRSEAVESSTLAGKLVWPEDAIQAGQVRLQLTLDGGRQRLAWPVASGKFSFPEVPHGSHLLDILAVGVLYPQFIVDIQPDIAEDPEDAIAVRFADQPKRVLPHPLIIRPLAKAEYFEKRQPFSIISYIKTPYGLMILFGVFVVVVLPKLKVDPEEETAASAEGQSSEQLPAQQPRERLTSRGSHKRRD